jgi:hypothetical protein
LAEAEGQDDPEYRDESEFGACGQRASLGPGLEADHDAQVHNVRGVAVTAIAASSRLGRRKISRNKAISPTDRPMQITASKVQRASDPHLSPSAGIRSFHQPSASTANAPPAAATPKPGDSRHGRHPAYQSPGTP